MSVARVGAGKGMFETMVGWEEWGRVTGPGWRVGSGEGCVGAEWAVGTGKDDVGKVTMGVPGSGLESSLPLVGMG